MCVTSEEGLWVEKSRQPDNARQRQVLSPAVQLFTTLQHIIIPDIQREREKEVSISNSQLYELHLLRLNTVDQTHSKTKTFLKCILSHFLKYNTYSHLDIPTKTHIPYSQAVDGRVGQLGPSIGDVVKEQGCLQLLHLRRDGQFTL